MNLQAEFGDVKNLKETTSVVFIVLANLIPLHQVAKYITTLLLEKQDNANKYTKRHPRLRSRHC